MTQVQIHSRTDNKIDYLFLYFASIYGYSWTSRHADTDAWKMTHDIWEKALCNINVTHIKKVLDKLMVSADKFPPTCGSFVNMCQAEYGLPTEEETLLACLRRDFSLNMSKLCFDKITSWEWTHDVDKDLRRKFKNAYNQVAQEFYRTQGEFKVISKIEPSHVEEKKIFDVIKTKMPDSLKELTKKMEEKALLNRKKQDHDRNKHNEFN